MSENEVIIGNLTTIIMFVFSACGGGAIIDALGGTSQASIIIGMILGLAFSIINAYYPNFFKFLNNHKRDIETVTNCISDEEHKCTCKSDEVVEDEEDVVDEEDEIVDEESEC